MPAELPSRNPPSDDLLWDGFAHAFARFLEQEHHNIRVDVSERNLCAHIAHQLQFELKNPAWRGYYADTEYNRKQGGRIKTIMDEESVVVTITCDLIVHSRGEIPAHDNLIAVEMKKAKHPEKAKQADRKRLRALTRSSYDGVWTADGKTLPEHVCGYRIGILIDLDAGAGRAEVEEYRRGEKVQTHVFTF